MKQHLRLEIKALRHQMADLEQRSQEREDKIGAVFEAISPFFEIMSEAQQKDLMLKLGIKE